MSKKRQRPPSRNQSRQAVVRSFAAHHFTAQRVPPHSHGWHQLIYASQGVMWVHTDQGEWVVPPSRAVWVPAGVVHSIDMSPVTVQTLYLAPKVATRMPRRCCAVNVSPLLRELIIHTVNLGTVYDRPAYARLIAFLLDQLLALPTIPLQLPLPAEDRARRAANWLLEHPKDPGLIKQLAERVGASPRTLERLFRKETGMTFGKWRQQLRLLQAMRLLASGRAVTVVAADVGYDSPSAFIAMFRRALGTTPRRYFANP